MRESRKIKRIVVKNLTQIYKTSNNIAKEWGVNTIPLNTLKTIIEKAKPAANTDEKSVNTFIKAYNNTLDTLYNTCVSIAKNMNSKNIPISQIKKGVDIIKVSYTT